MMMFEAKMKQFLLFISVVLLRIPTATQPLTEIEAGDG